MIDDLTYQQVVERRQELDRESNRHLDAALDVQRLRLDVGDVIIITSERRLPPAEKARITSRVSTMCPGHAVIVLDAGFSIATMGEVG